MEKPIYSPYETLQLPHNATTKDARRAYKKLIRVHTPEHDPENFMAIRDSYERFTEPERIDDEGKQFPIYKSPFNHVSSKQNASMPDLSPEIFSKVFETPFDTIYALSKLLDKVEEGLGLNEINEK